jgi:hypothetical protein
VGTITEGPEGDTGLNHTEKHQSRSLGIYRFIYLAIFTPGTQNSRYGFQVVLQHLSGGMLDLLIGKAQGFGHYHE